MATISSVVATGRRMKIRDGLMESGFPDWATAGYAASCWSARSRLARSAASGSLGCYSEPPRPEQPKDCCLVRMRGGSRHEYPPATCLDHQLPLRHPDSSLG